MDSSLKRFTDTGKWNDPWFRALTPTSKLLWSWLVDHCDNSGVIDPDMALASFQIGQPVNQDHIIEIGDRIEKISNGKYWIPKFVRFQFGVLSEESRVHSSVIKLLKHNQIDYSIDSLSIGNGSTTHTPKDKDKRKDKDKDKEKDGRTATLEEVKLCCQKTGVPESDAIWFWNKCQANGWTNGGKPIKSWPHTIASWKAAGYLPSQKNSKQSASRPVGGNF